MSGSEVLSLLQQRAPHLFHLGTQFTSFTVVQKYKFRPEVLSLQALLVQMLTPEHLSSTSVLSLLALLVQKYKC